MKADSIAQVAFVATYSVLRLEAEQLGATIIFVDEAHFRVDVDLRAQWVLRAQPAVVDSTSPRFGEKASDYSGVCMETEAVAGMNVTGNCNAATSISFLQQLRALFEGLLIVIWGNGPAHRRPALRTYLTIPGLNLRLVDLPAYSPNCNPGEASWSWAREDVTANICFGTAAKVREAVDHFFAGLVARTTEVKQCCRRELQAQADALIVAASQLVTQTSHVDLTLESV